MSDSVASIASITAFARAGATDHAWRLFAEAGWAARRDDPAGQVRLGDVHLGGERAIM